VKRKANQRTGHIPFGYRLADDGVALILVPAEQEVIQKILASREAGMSLREIADHLNSLAIPTKNGGKGWQPTTVNRVICRQAALVA
jgi:hypothetical protein